MLFLIPLLFSALLSSSPQDTSRWVTIFVHGNISIKPFLTLKNIGSFMSDSIDTTEYIHAADQIRSDPFFYHMQLMQDKGLLAIDKNSTKKGDACAACVKIWESIDAHLDKQEPHDYYTYGWSGLMSHKKRVQEAQDFYDVLLKLQQEYREKSINPKIRLVGYSHGGNLCLNLALFHNKETDFQIDELLFLGVPVQVENAHLVESEIFKKVYHFYSPVDGIQIVDCFSYKRFLSKRRFRTKRAQNIFQIPVSVVKRAERVTRRGRKRYLLACPPGHTELWFFGWTPFNYRPDFPLYPFALVHLLPLMMSCIKQELLTHARPSFALTFYPEESLFTIGDTRYNLYWHDMFKSLAQTAREYIPDNHGIREENEHLAQALARGKEIFESHRK